MRNLLFVVFLSCSLWHEANTIYTVYVFPQCWTVHPCSTKSLPTVHPRVCPLFIPGFAHCSSQGLPTVHPRVCPLFINLVRPHVRLGFPQFPKLGSPTRSSGFPQIWFTHTFARVSPSLPKLGSPTRSSGFPQISKLVTLKLLDLKPKIFLWPLSKIQADPGKWNWGYLWSVIWNKNAELKMK